MKLGVVVAMDKEFERVKALLEEATLSATHGQTFATGKVGRNTIVATQCGIGKTNAAIGTTQLLNLFEPEAVVSTGVAGGADTTLEVCDAVVATQTCYHDVYCGSEAAYGQIIGLPQRFDGDSALINKALSLQCGTTIRAGLTVTGDRFVDSRETMRSILEHFPNAMAVDMESAAIAQTCYLRHMPFVSFRIISDIPLKDNKAQQYVDFWARLADKSFSVTRALLQVL